MKHIMTIDEMASASDAQSKMEKWHKGERKQNIKACSDEKLKAYYMICLDKGYVMEANALYKEIVDRYLQDDVPKMSFEKVDGKLNADAICKYIDNHMNDIGDSGEDLFKFVKNDCVYYSWGTGDKNRIVDDYDCMIDKRNNIMKTSPDDEEPVSLDDTLEVINTINDDLFTS